MIPYQNNEEIITFFHKAQVKIAQLGEVVANEEEDLFHSQLLMDLANFLEALDSPYNTWTEIDILRYIHLWNKRADLNNVPYIQLTNYEVSINMGGTSPVGDIEATVRDILSRFPHNNLASLQGGSSSERYHLTKAELDWLQCQMAKTPCPDIIQPTVSISRIGNGILWPSGYFELGTSISKNSLQGAIVLNSGKSILSYSYYRGSTLLDQTFTPSLLDPINGYNDRTVISNDTTYVFQATFQQGGTKQAQVSILFQQPFFHGVAVRNQIDASTAILGTKEVEGKSTKTISFVVPQGNTLLPYGTDRTTYVFFPASWGIPSSVMSGPYDFKPDWVFTQQMMKLADGSEQPGILGVYTKTFEGETTFVFNF